MSGFANRSRFAGRSVKPRHALRLKLDHPIGTGHDRKQHTGSAHQISVRSQLVTLIKAESSIARRGHVGKRCTQGTG